MAKPQIESRFVKTTKLSILEDTLWEWLAVVDRYIRLHRREDVPWWYGERACLSVLAGAVWRTGGMVLEEYSAQKAVKRSATGERYSGRCDLYFRIGAKPFRAEAKYLKCPAGKKAGKAVPKIHQLLKQATSDARKSDEQGQKLALVFAVPWISETWKSDYKDLLENWIHRAEEVSCDAAAWTLPMETRNITDGDGSYLPGVALFIRSV